MKKIFRHSNIVDLQKRRRAWWLDEKDWLKMQDWKTKDHWGTK